MKTVTIPQIAFAQSFPVKGFPSSYEKEAVLRLDPSVGIVGDRRYAFLKPGEAGLAKAWFFKTFAYVGMQDPAVARSHIFVTKEGLLRVQRAGREFILKPNQPDLRGFSDFTGLEGIASALANSGGRYALCDNPMPLVSLGNLATLRAFAHYIGADEHPDYGLDLARFRINIWIEGLEPFAEYGWLERATSLMVGKASMRVVKPIVRCKSIELNPQSGHYDAGMLAMLLRFCQARNWGWAGKSGRKIEALFGVFAHPGSEGELHVGDPVFDLAL